MSAEIVVLGAGYAGLSAAKHFARSRHRTSVTVVNPRADFVERIRLHQFMAENHPAVKPLRELLPPSAKLIVDAAVTVDSRNQQLHMTSGDVIAYDYLVYAVGSRTRSDAIPGVAEHAVTVGSWDAACVAHQRLQALSPTAIVTVIGGGLTGIETAAELAELGTVAVRLVTSGELGTTLSARARAQLRSHFSAAGVHVIEHSSVAEIREGKVALADGTVLSSDLTVVAAAFAPPELAQDSGLDVDAAGALRVDDALVSVTSPRIIGAGDAAVLSERPLRMSCQAATPSGVHAADTILRLLAGRPPRPVRRKFVGHGISLGRHNALFQFTTLGDQPLRHAVMAGRLAAFGKEQICRITLRFGRIGPISFSWS
ncbi:NAD(P)/FAD-dependent oxidoreductase [Nocardia sp. SYP-A9097]|uniref:NAD(P)/FAD-dependent oxidoreductase n=1 Tax=Nocardia sp. SYP-A9097 TaxID=2663237 RepID=UPI001E346668|nr:FAD-dependent oxidoreductase [Nocardia sp. SYP-A9097]